MKTFDELVEEILCDKFLEYYQENSYDFPECRAKCQAREIIESYAEQVAQLLFDSSVK